MQCPLRTKEGKELFIAHSAGALAPTLKTAFEAHLKVCPECRRTAQAQEAVWASLDAWEPPPVSVDFNRRLYARLESERHWYRQSAWMERSFRSIVPIAAVCAVVLAGFLLKGPAVAVKPAAVVATEKQIDIEQVERALDDIDMLQQLGVVTPPAQPPAHSESL